MISLENDTRPIVTDAPTFKWSTNDNVRLLYRKCVGATDWVEVIGDPCGGGYEWVIRNDAGKIVEHSDCGYSCTDTCLRDGIAAYYHEPSVGDTREMETILRIWLQGGHELAAMHRAQELIMKMNRERERQRASMR